MTSEFTTTRIFQSWLTVVDDKTLREIWQHVTGLSHDNSDSPREWVVREIIRLAPQGIWKEYPEVVEEIDRYYETKATLRNMSKSLALQVDERGCYYMWTRTCANQDLQTCLVYADTILQSAPPGMLQEGSPRVGTIVLNAAEEQVWNVLEEGEELSINEVVERISELPLSERASPLWNYNRGSVAAVIKRMWDCKILSRRKEGRVYLYKRAGGEAGHTRIPDEKNDVGRRAEEVIDEDGQLLSPKWGER